MFNAAVWPGALRVKQWGLHGGAQRLSSTKTGLSQLTFSNQQQASHLLRLCVSVFPLIFALARIDHFTQDNWAQVQSLRNPKSPLRSRSCQAKINWLPEKKKAKSLLPSFPSVTQTPHANTDASFYRHQVRQVSSRTSASEHSQQIPHSFLHRANKLSVWSQSSQRKYRPEDILLRIWHSCHLLVQNMNLHFTLSIWFLTKAWHKLVLETQPTFKPNSSCVHLCDFTSSVSVISVFSRMLP